MASPFYTAEHEAYREVVRRFVEKEITPNAVSVYAGRVFDKVSKLSLAILEDLERGQNLSAALIKHPNVFPALYIDLIRVAELTGNLEAECVLVMQPKEGGGHRLMVFRRQKE